MWRHDHSKSVADHASVAQLVCPSVFKFLPQMGWQHQRRLNPKNETTAKLAATRFLFSAALHHAHAFMNLCPLELLEVLAWAESL